MPLILKTELADVASQINALLQADDYPNIIQPEYLKEAVRAYPCSGGKRLRPALLIWTCGLLEGCIEKTPHAAAAVEIYHNWTLVHDDIIDNDDIRRGELSTHCKLAEIGRNDYALDAGAAVKFGRDFAILAGDIQQGWAVNMLLKSVEDGVDPAVATALCRRLQELVNRELISGEAVDVQMPVMNRSHLSSAMVMEMIRQKTGVLLRFCAEAGAAIALELTDFFDPQIAALGRFAEAAGVAFQLRDDWLGVFGDFEKFGKTIGSDLTERKPTLLLMETWSRLSASKREELESLMGLPEYGAIEIERVRALMQDTGADKIVREMADFHVEESRNILLQFPDSKYRELLLDFTNYLVDRSL
jgi:geranylgeranyl pyrophosphate synthase